MNPEAPIPTDVIPDPSSEVEFVREARRQIETSKPILNNEDEDSANLNSPGRPFDPECLQKGSSVSYSRKNYVLIFFCVLFIANVALFAAGCWWYFEHTRAELIALAGKNKAPAAMPTVRASYGTDPALIAKIESLEKQLAAVSKRTQSSEEQSAQYSRRFAELAAQISDIAKPAPTPQQSLISDTPATDLPLAQSDLVILKERNRLTAYADEAIATGARGPYERLWDSLEDPRLANLAHAARSEIMRVQNCFLTGQRVKYYGIQQYQIPVAEIFTDSPALAPAQLSDEQLIQILQNQELVWQTRIKAAWYLGQRRNTKSAEALVKAIKEDPSLDVAAEATFSFEQVTGYHARLFEVQPLLAWWSSYNKATEK